MTHLRKLTAVLLAVIMVFALAACGQKDDTAAVDKDLTVNVVALNGTTGFGMAKLMSDSKAGTTALSYNFTVETDPSNATAALVNGTADIAALPTNAAAALYNKTDGAVQVLALNTRGVLYVVTDGTESITSFADLRRKNVCVPVQNPTFIFQYLCEKNGLARTSPSTTPMPSRRSSTRRSPPARCTSPCCRSRWSRSPARPTPPSPSRST